MTIKKICVISYFGLGDCIRYSPIFKGLEESIGPCQFDFTSSVIPLKNVFNANTIQILPIRFSKFYDIVINFIPKIKPENEQDEKIWRGFIKTNDSFTTTHGKIEDTYKEFILKFNQLDKNSEEVVKLCKHYSKLLKGSSVERLCSYMNIQPSSFDYLYKTTIEEEKTGQHLLSKNKKNICLIPRASTKIRSLTKEKTNEIYNLIINENVILIGDEKQCEDLKDLNCKKFFGDIRTAAAIIKNCDYVLSVDSYYSHVSFALGIPIIVLYSYAPHFALTPNKKNTIIYLEHLTENCNSIPIHEIQKAIQTI